MAVAVRVAESGGRSLGRLLHVVRVAPPTGLLTVVARFFLLPISSIPCDCLCSPPLPFHLPSSLSLLFSLMLSQALNASGITGTHGALCFRHATSENKHQVRLGLWAHRSNALSLSPWCLAASRSRCLPRSPLPPLPRPFFPHPLATRSSRAFLAVFVVVPRLRAKLLACRGWSLRGGFGAWLLRGIRRPRGGLRQTRGLP